MQALMDRIMDNISINSNDKGCWLWTGAMSNGYGYISINRNMKAAHKVLYELTKELVPEGLDLDHLCRVRHCVNPSHLEPVTRVENMRRSPLPNGGGVYQLKKTHCSKGHEYNLSNTYIRRDGGRGCRECRRLASVIFAGRQ